MYRLGNQQRQAKRTFLMTHDELLAICDNYDFKDSIEPVKALRAVVELCNKWETKGSYCIPIGDVIQAIEKELG